MRSPEKAQLLRSGTHILNVAINAKNGPVDNSDSSNKATAVMKIMIKITIMMTTSNKKIGLIVENSNSAINQDLSNEK